MKIQTGCALSCVALVLANCSDPPPSSSATTGIVVTAEEASRPLRKMTAWRYSTQHDDLHDRDGKQACVRSTDILSQGAPYHDTTASVCVRQNPRFGTAVFITLDSPGQMICSINDCSLKVRFDKGPVRRVQALTASDGSEDTLFFGGSRSMIEQIRRSSTMVVEVRLYQNGSQTVTFPTAGLEWPSAAPPRHHPQDAAAAAEPPKKATLQSEEIGGEKSSSGPNQ